VRIRTERDSYAILGVQATASDEEMKRAYRRLALRHHPDRNPGNRRAEELLVRVPPGLRPGTRLGLRGRGAPGADGAPGDLLRLVRAKA
jgi:DnaJ-class molecular chaperone